MPLLSALSHPTGKGQHCPLITYFLRVEKPSDDINNHLFFNKKGLNSSWKGIFLKFQDFLESCLLIQENTPTADPNL
jgi:hypothetical protein